MPHIPKRVRPLTIYATHEGVTDQDQIIDERDKLNSAKIDFGGPVGVVYARRSKSKSPAWVELLEQGANLEDFHLKSATASAVVLLQRQGRVFALTFGYGRSLLNLDKFETDFGLRVTLNSVDADKLRSMEQNTFEAVARHTRVQLSKDSGLELFGLNVEQDIVRAVTGAPTDDTLGRRMSGHDSLAVTVKADLRDIPPLLDRYLEQFQSVAYRDRFPWIDNVVPIRSAAIRQRLDGQLERSLRRSGSREAIHLTPPEVIEWDRIGGFSFSRDSHTIRDSLELPDYARSVGGWTNVSADGLSKDRVLCYQDDEQSLIGKWPVYRCIYTELVHDGRTYVLSNGAWYEIDDDFLSRLNVFVNDVQPASVLLPQADDAEPESAYNERCARSLNASCLDQQLVRYGGGRSQIELCDIMTASGTLLHVKHYTTSATLSHLFAQGATSGQLLVSDREFRSRVIERFPGPVASQVSLDHFDARQYKVGFVILGRDGPASSLPLFSRITLRHNVQLLRGFGYQVTLTFT